MQTEENSSKSLEIATLGSAQVAKRTAPRRFNFTKKKLDEVKPTTNAQRGYYYDTTTRGLTWQSVPRARKFLFSIARSTAGPSESPSALILT
jgi:hypothetical protein